MKKLLITFTVFAAVIVSACSPKTKELVTNDETQEEVSKKEEYKQRMFDNYFFAAKSEVIKGNTQKGISRYQEALEIYPDNDAVMYEIGQLYFELKNYDEAINWLTKATTTEPKNPWYWLKLAETQMQKANYNEAAIAYEKGALLYKKQVEYYLRSADAYLRAKKYPECIAILDSVEVQFGMNEQLVMQKADIYRYLGKKKQAIAEVRKLVNQIPNDPHYLTLLGEMFLDLNEIDSALKIFNQVLIIQPENGSVHFNLAELYRQKGDKANFLKELQLAIKDPEFDVSKKISSIYSLMPQMQADPQLAEAVGIMADNFFEAHEGDADAYIIKSEVLAAQNKYKEAREYLLTALEMRSDDFSLWRQLLSLDELLKDHQAMADDSRKVIELFPHQLIPYATGCIANLQLKQYNKTIEIAEEALVFAINKEDKAQFYSYIADAYHGIGNHTKSDEYYEKVLAINPADALVMNNYAYYLSLRSDNLTRAAELSLTSLKLYPDNPSYMDTYGWILYKQGKYEEAKQWIKKSLDAYPESPEVLEHYGDVLFKLGNVNEAVEYWQKAKNSGSTSADLDKKIANKKLYE